MIGRTLIGNIRRMSKVATEREPKGPIVLPRAAIIALMRAADGARRAMTRTLHAFDLTLPQFNVLTILWHHNELPTFQVAARMVEATPGITRLMKTLEAKGYVRRSQSVGDRRQQLCALTTEGRRVVEAAIPPFTTTQKRLIGDLDRSEALQLTALLWRVPAAEKANRGRNALSLRPRLSARAPTSSRPHS